MHNAAQDTGLPAPIAWPFVVRRWLSPLALTFGLGVLLTQ